MLNWVYGRYIAASAAALGVDFAIFMAALSLHVPPAFAAALGYLAGIVCHWLISSRAVFVGHVAEAGARRWHQQLLFTMSALVGLGITMAIVGVGSRYGLDPKLAKAGAIVVSFQLTYLIRKNFVFGC
jgi:putative flippase GtrA